MKVVAKKPFSAKNVYKPYMNMFHGWAAARADLKNEENKKQYVYLKLPAYRYLCHGSFRFADVYATLASFVDSVWKA